jgi:hypothetical protein
VAKAFPKIPNSEDSGWTASLDTSAFPPGMHEVVVQATTNEWATRDLASISVNIVAQ